MRISKKEWLGLGLALALAVLPTVPAYFFGRPAMFQSHDAIIHPARLAHIEEAFRQGVLIPDWLTSFTFGFGSPALLFSWFLPYYPALLFRFLGACLADAVKLVFLASTVVSGATIYFLARRLTAHWPALAAIGLFLLSPVRLNMIFTRGSFGEAFAQMFAPLVLALLLWRHWLALPLAALAIAALVASHFLSFMFLGGLLAGWLIFVSRSKEERKKIIFALIGGLLLSLFYWLPSFLEQRYILYAEVSRRWYAAQFPSFWALIFSPWQYGPPQPAQQALSMSFQIGKIHWLVFLLAPLLILWQKKLSLLPRRAARFWLAVFIVAIFLQLPVSKPLWDGLGFARIITFPWRLQAVAVLAVSLLAALLISVLPRQRLAVAVLFILLLFANRRHFAVSLGDYAGDTYLREFGFNGGSAVEYLPIWASEGEYGQRFREQPRNVPVILAPSAMVHIVRADFLPTAILLDLAAPEATTVAVRQYYFPGWEGKLDGRPLPLFPARGGLINFAFPAGEHKIALRFTDTPLRRATKLISLAVLIIGAGWVLKYKHKL